MKSMRYSLYKIRLKCIKEKNKEVEYLVKEKDKNKYRLDINDIKSEIKEVIIKKDKIFKEEELDILLEKIKILSKQINPNDINNISNSGEQNIDENSKKYLSMSLVNKLMRSVIILKNKFNNNKKIRFNLIVIFVFELLFEEELTDSKKVILDILINVLLENNENKKDLGDEEYFFDKSQT